MKTAVLYTPWPVIGQCLAGRKRLWEGEAANEFQIPGR